MGNNKKELIAPCGINCAVCIGYLAYLRNIEKQKGISYCMGCRPRNKQCAFLKKNCSKLRSNKVAYCFECTDFPCQRLKHLDERYKRDYDVSLIENLMIIKKNGIEAFLQEQQEKYKCTKCGESIGIHNRFCYSCEQNELLEYVRTKKSSIRKVSSQL